MLASDLPATYDLTAVIVNYNSGAFLPVCLRALREAAGPLSLEIVIVDNGSTDGSLTAADHDPGPLQIILAGANLGFSRANNLGMRTARGRHYLLVNSDCFVDPGLPATLLRRLEADPHRAVVGPRLRNPDGTLQRSCHNFPAPTVLFLEQSLLWQPLRRLRYARRRLQIASDHTRPRPVDWLSGACLLVRAEAFAAVGGFDTGFFFYWEEADLCRRMRERGWTVLFEPAAGAVHVGGGSSAHPLLVRQFFKSLYRFYGKHYAPRQLRLARLIVVLLALFKTCRAGFALLREAPTHERQDATEAEWRTWLSVVRLRP